MKKWSMLQEHFIDVLIDFETESLSVESMNNDVAVI